MMSKSNKKEFNRESLLNEGVALFMGQGYHGTGLQEILDAVNVPKGSFYNYFDSKEDFGGKCYPALYRSIYCTISRIFG